MLLAAVNHTQHSSAKYSTTLFYCQVTGRLDWTEQCFTSPPTQYTEYRLYGRRLLQVRRPNQQYQSTEEHTQITEKHNNCTHITQNTASPLVYNNMG